MFILSFRLAWRAAPCLDTGFAPLALNRAIRAAVLLGLAPCWVSAASGPPHRKRGEKYKIHRNRHRKEKLLRLRHGRERERVGGDPLRQPVRRDVQVRHKSQGKIGQCSAVCESTGNLWVGTANAFEKAGIPIQLSNPFRTGLIAKASVKTDKVDARALAGLLRSDMLAMCYIGTARESSKQLFRYQMNLRHDPQLRIGPQLKDLPARLVQPHSDPVQDVVYGSDIYSEPDPAHACHVQPVWQPIHEVE